MTILSATYNVEMPKWCYIDIPSEREFYFSVVDEEYSVSMSFALSEWGVNATHPEKKSVRGITKVMIELSKEFNKFPDLTAPLVHHSVNQIFSKKAIELLNRVTHFFRYSQYTPLLKDFNYEDGQFAQPYWRDQRGNPINVGITSFVIPTRAGQSGNLRATPFDTEDITKFVQRISNPVPHSLVEQLLSDAQNAWFNRAYFSAVIEMAIACEHAINGVFKEEIAENWEKEADKRLGIVHFLHKPAIIKFQRSLKSEQPEEFKKIEYLFRCRNKVAHEASLSFKGLDGTPITPTKEEIAEWWYASFNLMKWIQSLNVFYITFNPAAFGDFYDQLPDGTSDGPNPV